MDTHYNESKGLHLNYSLISEMVEEFLKYHEENGIISYRTLNVQKKYETHLNKRTILENGTVKTERVYLKVTDGDLHNMSF